MYIQNFLKILLIEFTFGVKNKLLSQWCDGNLCFSEILHWRNIHKYLIQIFTVHNKEGEKEGWGAPHF